MFGTLAQYKYKIHTKYGNRATNTLYKVLFNAVLHIDTKFHTF